MKPPPFKYVQASSLDDAVVALAASGGDAKIIAGGQSLVPMLNFRLLRPAVLVDINRIPDLDFVSESPAGLRIGALTRHRTLETSARVASAFPVLAEAMTHVAHLAIRNRGTIGGSLSHADPAAELPMLALLLDATIIAAGSRGRRSIAAKEFFVGALTTALEPDEIVTEIELPRLPPATGWGFEEYALRRGDFAIAAAAATVTLGQSRCVEARIALIGGGDRPVRAAAAEALLQGRTPGPELIAQAARAARDGVDPDGDLHASAEFRAHLIGVLTARALEAACERAAGAGR